MSVIQQIMLATFRPLTELGPLGLSFSQVNEVSPFNLAPSGLIDMSEPFTADTGQFTKYTENTAGTTSVASGKMTITHSGVMNDIVTRADISYLVPQAWVEATFTTSTLGSSYDAGGVGIFKDANNFLISSFDKLNSIIRIQIKIAGTTTFISSITQAFISPFRFAISLVGNSVCVWYDSDGTGLKPKVLADVGATYDFRTAGNLTGWKPGFQLANGGGSTVWNVSAFKNGRFGSVGLRDMTIVTNEDGTPYFPAADQVLFTATAVDPRGTGYTGVWQLDLTLRTITQKSVIFVNRGGKSYNDLSAHVIYYASGNRRMLIGTWANGFGGSIQTLYGLLTTGDVLTGTNLVSLSAITLPGQTGSLPGAYDATMVYDAANSRWLIAYTLTTDTNFTGSPFYAAACYTTAFSSFTLIGADTAHTGYEGTKIFNAAGAYYIGAGGPAGSGNSSRVYDGTMTYIGAFNAVFHGGADTQPHPMVFPYGSKQLLLTFDNTKYNSGSFTWGDVEIFEAQRYQ